MVTSIMIDSLIILPLPPVQPVVSPAMTPLSPNNPFAEDSTNPFAADMEEEADPQQKVQSPQEQVGCLLGSEYLKR